MDTDRKPALVGFDVGTSGVRGVAVSPAGELLAEADEKIGRDHRAAGGIHEQDPDEWWEALCSAGQAIVQSLKEKSGDLELRGVAVTSTSGSLVVADAEGRPLRPAILYDDSRGVEIAEELNKQGGAQSIRLGPSFSLVKAAWVRQREPELWERARYILHPADWLSGKLTGEFGISDFTNALKLGYDPESRAWIGTVRAAGLPNDRLPVVRRPAEQIGKLSGVAAAATGLPVRTPVLAGATDGMASVIASGAIRRGDANTTLGTTLVWKVLHDRKPAARGGIYFHLHPGGLWVPGAASNTGLGSIRTARRRSLDWRNGPLGCPLLPNPGGLLHAVGTRRAVSLCKPQSRVVCGRESARPRRILRGAITVDRFRRALGLRNSRRLRRESRGQGLFNGGCGEEPSAFAVARQRFEPRGCPISISHRGVRGSDSGGNRLTILRQHFRCCTIHDQHLGEPRSLSRPGPGL